MVCSTFSKASKKYRTELPEQPRTPFWKLVLEQFGDRMVQILLVSAVISFVCLCESIFVM